MVSAHNGQSSSVQQGLVLAPWSTEESWELNLPRSTKYTNSTKLLEAGTAAQEEAFIPALLGFYYGTCLQCLLQTGSVSNRWISARPSTVIPLLYSSCCSMKWS